jgi:hypothetical protein
VDNNFDKMAVVALFFECPGHEQGTDHRHHPALPGRALPEDTAAAEPIVRELLERAAGRLRLLCGTLLHKSYPRLTRPPANLETDELLGDVAPSFSRRLVNFGLVVLFLRQL